MALSGCNENKSTIFEYSKIALTYNTSVNVVS